MRKLTALLVSTLILAGCKNLAPGYRAVTAISQVGNKFGMALALICKGKRQECDAKHVNDKDAADKCKAQTKCKEALTRWVNHVKPALNTGLAATFAGLETAYQAGKREYDWLSGALTWGCALVKSIKQWTPIIGNAKAKEWLTTLASLGEKFVCR